MNTTEDKETKEDKYNVVFRDCHVKRMKEFYTATRNRKKEIKKEE